MPGNYSKSRHRIIYYVYKYTEGVQKQIKSKAQPEPWLHVGFTCFGNDKHQTFRNYVIFVWDTRQVIEEGMVRGIYAADNGRYSYMANKLSGTPALDNAKPLSKNEYSFGRNVKQDGIAYDEAEKKKAADAAAKHQQALDTPRSTHRILQYTESVQEQLGSKTKPEPWLHVAVTDMTYAIYVWDTRQIVEVGECDKLPKGKPANDNRQPLVGSKADKFKMHAAGVPLQQKDYDRMLNEVLANRNGAKMAASIKDKNKAIARYAAYHAIRGTRPNPDKSRMDGEFGFDDAKELAQRALQLGATKQDLLNAVKDADVPEDILRQYDDAFGGTKDKRGGGSCWAPLVENGLRLARIKFEAKASNALTDEGREAMRRNGRKWTEGITVKIWPGTPNEGTISYDAVTDEGDGPTYYVFNNSTWKTSLPYGRCRQRDLANAAVAYGNSHRPE